jgi:hypothetical protein
MLEAMARIALTQPNEAMARIACSQTANKQILLVRS